MARGAFAFVRPLATKKSFAIAALLQVNGESDRGAAGRFGALYNPARNFPDVCRIELLPDRHSARGGHVLDGRRRRGGEDLQMVFCPSRARDANRAIGMKCFFAADGADDQGAAPGGAK